MRFFVFRCSTDPELFVALATPEIPAKVLALCKGPWVPHKNFPSTGEPRLAYPSEDQMKAGIDKDGYYTFRAGVYVKEVKGLVAPKKGGKKRKR
jgi:hypothetical protein